MRRWVTRMRARNECPVTEWTGERERENSSTVKSKRVKEWHSDSQRRITEWVKISVPLHFSPLQTLLFPFVSCVSHTRTLMGLLSFSSSSLFGSLALSIPSVFRLTFFSQPKSALWLNNNPMTRTEEWKDSPSIYPSILILILFSLSLSLALLLFILYPLFPLNLAAWQMNEWTNFEWKKVLLFGANDCCFDFAAAVWPSSERCFTLHCASFIVSL